MSHKKKVIISACLLGAECRYDGKAKKVDRVIKKNIDYEIIPFCPEAPIFGVPRERINVVELNDKYRIITDKTNLDVTQKLEKEISSFIQKNQDVDEIILKSKSPSCGYGSTPILNEKREVVKLGNGIASQMLQEYFKNIKIKDEFGFGF